MRRLRVWLVASACLGAALAAPAAAEEPRLARALRAFVALNADVAPQSVDLPPLHDFEPEASLPDIEFDFSTHPRADFTRLTPVTVVFWEGPQERRRGSVSVRIRRGESVLVAARALPARTVLRESDVRRQTATGPVPSDRATRLEDLVGKRTTRRLVAGAVLQGSHVAPVPVVTRGDLVRIRLEQGALWIEGLGRARDDGLAGERVRVLNLTSRQEIQGTVLAEGVVRVAY